LGQLIGAGIGAIVAFFPGLSLVRRRARNATAVATA
jgi:hypothetical protein